MADWCRCGHSHYQHQHIRSTWGTNCAMCDCVSFRRDRRRQRELWRRLRGFVRWLLKWTAMLAGTVALASLVAWLVFRG